MQTPTLSHVILTPQQAIAHVMQANMVHPGHYSCAASVIKRASIGPNIPILFGSEERGILVGKQFVSDNRSLFLYFEHDLPLEIGPYLWCTPVLDIALLQCPACQTTYEPGDAPCGCIMRCHCLHLQKISVTGVRFHDSRNDIEITADFRSNILGRFFGGPVGQLKILDPL